MPTVTVKFEDVGRDKRSWERTFRTRPDSDALEREVRRSGALRSNDIECVFDSDSMRGTVFVGGWRPVGKFSVEPQAA